MEGTGDSASAKNSLPDLLTIIPKLSIIEIIDILETQSVRVTSVELHQKLGQTIDMARLEPVTVTKHDRDHVVILSAEAYDALRQGTRRARLTSSLTAEERAQIVAGRMPTKAEQRRFLAEMAAAMAAKDA